MRGVEEGGNPWKWCSQASFPPTSNVKDKTQKTEEEEEDRNRREHRRIHPVNKIGSGPRLTINGAQNRDIFTHS